MAAIKLKVEQQLAEQRESPTISFSDQYIKDEGTSHVLFQACCITPNTEPSPPFFAGCVALCQAIQVSQTLSSLDLRGNDIRTAGARAIASLLKVNSSLRRFCCCFKEFTLSSFQNLSFLSLFFASLKLEWNFLGLDEALQCVCDALCTNNSVIHVRPFISIPPPPLPPLLSSFSFLHSLDVSHFPDRLRSFTLLFLSFVCSFPCQCESNQEMER